MHLTYYAQSFPELTNARLQNCKLVIVGHRMNLLIPNYLNARWYNVYSRVAIINIVTVKWNYIFKIKIYGVDYRAQSIGYKIDDETWWANAVLASASPHFSANSPFIRKLFTLIVKNSDEQDRFLMTGGQRNLVVEDMRTMKTLQRS